MNTRCCDCCHPEFKDSEACGCCEGLELLTPVATYNRPGLDQLRYRAGTHGSFLETMKARLSGAAFPELAGLTTRDPDDPAIALLDAWATVADVLTFYQERIANEGYLRTAGERRSILELARLVGYRLRPGVAASVFLAYTIDDNTAGEVTIPIGSRAQSVPGPGELPQSFETGEELKARQQWNNLRPRLSQPQTAQMIANDPRQTVYLKGTNTGLQINDPLLLDNGFGSEPLFRRVKEIEPDIVADRTRIALQPLAPAAVPPLVNTVELIKDLTLRPSLQPANRLRLSRALGEQFKAGAESGYRVLGSLSRPLRDTLVDAAANARVTRDSPVKIYALRVTAPLFGHNAPRQPQYHPTFTDDGEGNPRPNLEAGNLMPQPWEKWPPDGGEAANVLHLDRGYDQILAADYVVVENPADKVIHSVFRATDVRTISRHAYGLSAETTRITLDGNWWDPAGAENIDIIRGARVYAQPEELELAEAPIDTPICGGVDDLIELDGFYDGLEAGRWVIVSGERELDGTSGVRFSELAMLSTVTQDVVLEERGTARLGEKTHTFIKLASELAYCFKRDTVTLYGNVAKATHGETRQEVLGSGDGSNALQAFTLKQKPLTHVSASNPSGVDSTLEVFVNDLQWHEVVTLADRQATDRHFITQTDDEDNTTVSFGNGERGARLPTGVENIRAVYRSGIGKPGNVKAEQISLLQTKPLGVKAVVNPLRASGGADREGRDQARENAPLAVKALDRLVSVRDYQDFSRTFAGIGKAHALELTDGRRQFVHVTIAGADDIPIDETSDLFRNLRRALSDFGDPHLPIRLAVRELLLVVISARVRIRPDYQWEPVVAGVRAALLDAFSFGRSELGRDLWLSEVISVVQAVRGVDYVDVDTFGGVPEKKASAIGESGVVERRLLSPDEIAETVQAIIAESEARRRPNPSLSVNLAALENGVMRPAQLAFLAPDVPETLILNQIE
ncbi:putative baseplate assembly protein [Exilibacterium tricleocarpae]|uniref:Putative baseplate assembly protein n=1 Tax=Exilibacterium tricleocarpae TaxID=2591008 RepID=A0A545TZ29_9GAMM|nr:putative baseplate assembly protein [Exilibacterium tricleocarpae]TQV82475.1 putative baseplate assembly protein [Exilibacterium tricleocarpae]